MSEENHISYLHCGARNALLKADRRRIGYTEHNRLVKSLLITGLLNHFVNISSSPVKTGSPIYLLTGEKGTGKTTLVRALFHNSLKKFKKENALRTFLVTCRPSNSLKGCFEALLREDLKLIPPSGPVSAIISEMARAIKTLGVRILMIDEFSLALDYLPGKQAAYFKAVSDLAAVTPAIVLLVGDLNLPPIVEQHMSRQVIQITLPRLKERAQLGEFLRSLERSLPLRLPSTLTSNTMMSRISEITDGDVGKIVALIRNAAARSIRKGTERIEISDLCREER